MCRSWNTFKSWSTKLTVACFFLAGGIEYSVILPTAWDYLVRLGVNPYTGKWLYGFTLATMSISNMFAGPFLGALFDRYGRAKLIILFATLFEILANFLYFAADSKYFGESPYVVIASRLLVGVGIGGGAVLFGEIARISSKKARTAVFTLFLSARQFGLIFGPAFNVALNNCNFYIGPFHVSNLTSPGLFMVLVWTFIEILFIFLFFHLPTIKDEEDETAPATENTQEVTKEEEAEEEEEGEEVKTSSTSGIYSNAVAADSSRSGRGSSHSLTSSSEDHAGLNMENEPLIARKSPNIQYGTQPQEESYQPVKKRKSLWHSEIVGLVKHVLWALNEMLREEVVILLAVLFITLFNQMTLETGLVPLVEAMLKWTEFETSLFFSGAGVVLLLAFVVIWIIASKIGDRWMIMFGLGVTLLAYIWCVVFLGSGVRSSWSLAQLIIGSVPVIFALPFIFVAGISLYSKVLPSKIQGFGQGVRRSVASVASIMGPLWAGAAMNGMTTYYLFYGVPLGLLILIIFLMLLSFSVLKEQHNKLPDSKHQIKLPDSSKHKTNV